MLRKRPSISIIMSISMKSEANYAGHLSAQCAPKVAVQDALVALEVVAFILETAYRDLEDLMPIPRRDAANGLNRGKRVIGVDCSNGDEKLDYTIMRLVSTINE